MAKKPNNFVFESSSYDASSESSFSPDSEDCKTSDGEIDNTFTTNSWKKSFSSERVKTRSNHSIA